MALIGVDGERVAGLGFGLFFLHVEWVLSSLQFIGFHNTYGEDVHWINCLGWATTGMCPTHSRPRLFAHRRDLSEATSVIGIGCSHGDEDSTGPQFPTRNCSW